MLCFVYYLVLVRIESLFIASCLTSFPLSSSLSSLIILFRYTRLTMTERYGGMTEAEGFAVRWNKKLEGTQKIRMSSAVDQESADEDSLLAAVSEDDSSSSTSDSSND